MRVFVAGAGGVIGRRLVPQLVERGHQVVATTRDAARNDDMRALGATPAVMDGLDPASVGEAVARAEPDVVVHQMTALAGFGDLKNFDRGFATTNELRTRGTDNLLAASDAVGVDRFVAQSFTGWPNERSGAPVKSEDDPLEPNPPAHQRKSLEAIRYLERAVVAAAPVGLVLRYGSLYGPGTSMANEYAQLIRERKLPLVGDGAGIWSFVHADDAAPRRFSPSREATEASTTWSTTNPSRSRSGCPTWRTFSAPGRLATCRPGSRGSRSATSGWR